MSHNSIVRLGRTCAAFLCLAHELQPSFWVGALSRRLIMEWNKRGVLESWLGGAELAGLGRASQVSRSWKIGFIAFFKGFIGFLLGFIGIFGTVTAFHDIFNVLLCCPMDFLAVCFKILVFL